MVKLVKGENTTVRMVVSSVVSYSGMNGTLEVMGVTKTIADMNAKNIKIVFSAADAEAVGDLPVYGTLVVKDSKNNVLMTAMVEFVAVETERDAAGFDLISVMIPIPFNLPHGGGGGGGGDETLAKAKAYTDKCFEDQRDEFLDIDNPSRTVNSLTGTVTEMLLSLKGQKN